MGSGTLCVGCNWHEDSTAPEARRGCRLSLPGSARFHAAPRQYGGRGGFFWRVVCFVWAVTCMRRPPRRRRGMDAGSACGVIRRRRFLWGVMRFVWAVSHIWTAPPVRAEVYAGSTRPHPRGARFLWAVGTSYNERRILWAVICFVWAVTGIRTAPPAARRGCRANQPAFMPRLANTTAGDSYGKSVRPIMSKRSYGKWYALYKL